MDTQRVYHLVQTSDAIILAEVLSPLHTTIVSPVVDGTKQTCDKPIWCNYGLKLYPMHLLCLLQRDFSGFDLAYIRVSLFRL